MSYTHFNPWKHEEPHFCSHCNAKSLRENQTFCIECNTCFDKTNSKWLDPRA